MDEFLDQFLIEARELTTAASDEISALELQSVSKRSVDALFRVFHTLKGAAGIVDFAALARLMHAAEEQLAVVQRGESTLSTGLLRDFLACIDLLVRWLDEIAAGGDLPADAPQAADALIRRHFSGAAAAPSGPMTEPLGADEIARIFPSDPSRDPARTLVRYVPKPDCFFAGVDPLALVAGLPGLLEVRLSSREPFADLARLNVFNCNLIVYALSTASRDDLAPLIPPDSGQVDIQDIVSNLRTPGVPGSASKDIVANIMEAQLRSASHARPGAGFEGRLEAVGTTAQHVAIARGMPELAAMIEQATVASVTAGSPTALRDALVQVRNQLTGIPSAAPVLAPSSGESMTSLRVDVRKIDAIVKLVGELSVAGNAFGYLADLAEAGEPPAALARHLRRQQSELWRLIEDLQHSALAIRVVPLRHLFQRFPRFVREISGQLDKDVALTTVGDETEADKAVVEGLFEPLLHILRNAIDHGVEDPDARRERGKSPSAEISMRAYRQGDAVIIDVADDGGGIDPAMVKRVALAKGLAAPDFLESMSDDQAIDLIFMSGFSTASAVSDISGRGVGMNAVRDAIIRLGGRITVLTEVGVGTTFRLAMPFSVMLSRILTVSVAGQTFGIPLDAIVEMVQVPREQVVPVGTTRAMVYRGQTVPFISLPGALGQPELPETSQSIRVIIALMGKQLCALEVDQFGERMDLMLNPRQGLLTGLRGIAGTALMGDGRVLIVLDLQELLE